MALNPFYFTSILKVHNLLKRKLISKLLLLLDVRIYQKKEKLY